MSVRSNNGLVLDWITFRVSSEHFYFLCFLMGLGVEDFVGGGLRYRRKYRGSSSAFDGVTVYTDFLPFLDRVAICDTDCYLEFSGVGVSSYFTDFSHFVVCLHEWFSLGFIVTRIDFAFDSFSGDFSPESVYKAVMSGYCVTSLKSVSRIGSSTIPTPLFNNNNNNNSIENNGKSHNKRKINNLGSTVYIGKKGGDILIRIYDKKALNEKLKIEMEKDIKAWVRSEFEFHGAYAQKLAFLINTSSGYHEIVNIIRKTCLGYLDFVGSDGVRLRWWARLMGKKAGLKLRVSRSPKSIDRTKKWLDRSVARALAAVEQEYPGNAAKLVQKGKKRNMKNTEHGQ